MSERVTDVEATEGGSAPSGEPVRVRRALISVSDKTGVVDFARGLSELGVELLSTGGTASAIREAGLEVTDVSVFTGQEEILGGRVKTLHPRLHAALLAKRDSEEHMATLEREGIEPIDLVCVNLYPFSQTVSRPDVTEEEAVENIDIGGPTMIRAAAKNHRSVAVLVRPESYDAVLAELEASDGSISEETRHWLANEAWADIARLRRGDLALVRVRGTRRSRSIGCSPTRSSSTSPMARTRIRRRRSMWRRERARTSWREWRSSTAARSRSTTCLTWTRRRSSLRSSKNRQR